ncbi:hypothetical protein L9F63_002358 [Diploptera punctata]|uniref:Uncharacterized protein n=1 Tax=Diploptera punctata TaxID=6984 RepID=A0AAD8A3I5_DIPPU|nr:hypothetical protein L9F63_002358 [Diploptera punctata]
MIYCAKIILLVLGIAEYARGTPIMVEFGTRMAAITPPTPRPRLPILYPLLPPAPVYEDAEPENNSVYRSPVSFGFRIKPLKSFGVPLSTSKYYYHQQSSNSF